MTAQGRAPRTPSAQGWAAPDLGLDDKVAVVTGAAGGIGSALVRRLLDHGATVVATDVAGSEEPLAALAGLAPDRVHWVTADIAVDAEVAAVVDRALQATGRIDVLANVGAVTGAGLSQDLDILTTPLDVWDRVVAVNLRGTMLMCRAALPAMIAGSGGAVVNVSSGAAVRASHNLCAYSASKAAVNNLTLHIAKAFGPDGIRCNAIMPGLIAGTGAMTLSTMTEGYLESVRRHTPVGRLGAPDDIASLAAFLASDRAAGFITGQIIACDGGTRI